MTSTSCGAVPAYADYLNAELAKIALMPPEYADQAATLTANAPIKASQLCAMAKGTYVSCVCGPRPLDAAYDAAYSSCVTAERNAGASRVAAFENCNNKASVLALMSPERKVWLDCVKAENAAIACAVPAAALDAEAQAVSEADFEDGLLALARSLGLIMKTIAHRAPQCARCDASAEGMRTQRGLDAMRTALQPLIDESLSRKERAMELEKKNLEEIEREKKKKAKEERRLARRLSLRPDFAAESRQDPPADREVESPARLPPSALDAAAASSFAPPPAPELLAPAPAVGATRQLLGAGGADASRPFPGARTGGAAASARLAGSDLRGCCAGPVPGGRDSAPSAALSRPSSPAGSAPSKHTFALGRTRDPSAAASVPSRGFALLSPAALAPRAWAALPRGRPPPPPAPLSRCPPLTARPAPEAPLLRPSPLRTSPSAPPPSPRPAGSPRPAPCAEARGAFSPVPRAEPAAAAPPPPMSPASLAAYRLLNVAVLQIALTPPRPAPAPGPTFAAVSSTVAPPPPAAGPKPPPPPSSRSEPLRRSLFPRAWSAPAEPLRTPAFGAGPLPGAEHRAAAPREAPLAHGQARVECTPAPPSAQRSPRPSGEHRAAAAVQKEGREAGPSAPVQAGQGRGFLPSPEGELFPPGCEPPDGGPPLPPPSAPPPPFAAAAPPPTSTSAPPPGPAAGSLPIATRTSREHERGSAVREPTPPGCEARPTPPLSPTTLTRPSQEPDAPPAVPAPPAGPSSTGPPALPSPASVPSPLPAAAVPAAGPPGISSAPAAAEPAPQPLPSSRPPVSFELRPRAKRRRHGVSPYSSRGPARRAERGLSSPPHDRWRPDDGSSEPEGGRRRTPSPRPELEGAVEGAGAGGGRTTHAAAAREEELEEGELPP
eukprot:tig00001127_g7136.t1